MNKAIYKLITLIATFTLVFSTVGVSATFAAESLAGVDHLTGITTENSEETNETILNSDIDYLYLNSTIPSENLNVPEIIDGEITPQAIPVIPLLAGIVIRAGATYIARITTGQVVRVSSHATIQAVERRISAKAIDKALSYGERYVDILSQERIAWDLESGVAVLLKPNSDEVDTVYVQDGKKLKWFKNSWRFVGDIK